MKSKTKKCFFFNIKITTFLFRVWTGSSVDRQLFGQADLRTGKITSNYQLLRSENSYAIGRPLPKLLAPSPSIINELNFLLKIQYVFSHMGVFLRSTRTRVHLKVLVFVLEYFYNERTHEYLSILILALEDICMHSWVMPHPAWDPKGF